MTLHSLQKLPALLALPALILCARQTAAAESADPAPLQVARWQPHDFSFHSTAQPDNPFSTAFSAEAIGPDDIRLTMPGFFDGEGTWKIRFSPTAMGNWTLRTHSPIADLDAREVKFICAANASATVHGGLRVDAAHPRHFVFEDGARFYPLGYECDWLWALDADDPSLKTVGPFLDKLTSYNFNYIILNTYAHDTSWRKGKTGADDYGPPASYPWAGSNDAPDYSRFNLAYWQHYDCIIEALRQRGIVAHVLFKVYNKMVNWPAKGSPEDDLFFRWVIARYAACPNVTWDFAKEAQYEKDLPYKTGRLQFIRANDPYHRLLTVHDDKAAYDRGVFNGLVDYRSDQQHADWRKTLLEHRGQHPWPVVNTEFGYEHGPGGPRDMTYNHAQDAQEVCRRAWEIALAGGYTTYYYTYTAWDVLRPRDNPPGYGYLKNLRAFFETAAYWRMEPAEGLTSEGYCLADPGREYIVFLPAVKPFTLTLQGLPGPLKAQWYQPFTGEKQDAGSVSNGTVELKPPAQWSEGPAALHVGAPTP